MLIAINTNGTVEMIYQDSMRELLNEGQSAIKRASHVEPTQDNKWEADMSPVNGETLVGFKTRESALKAEVSWLEKNYLGK